MPAAEPSRSRHVCGAMIQQIAHLGLLDDEAIILDSSALELAALDHPGFDLAPYADVLGEITGSLLVRGATARSAKERADALAEVIAGDMGFEGDRDTYDDPANADLIEVIDRKRGLPVSLSILYVATARRIGWQADALNTPGHVLVRIGPATAPVLVDPFNGGVLVDSVQLASLLTNMLGGAAVPLAEHVEPMSNRSVLVRLLTNQATRAEAAGEVERALVLYSRMTTIAPSHAHAWWEQARLELVQGEVASARASLSAMLEVTRDAGLREHISAALDALAGSAP